MLDTAFRGDPYDLVTLNLLRVLDTLDGFETQKSGVATIRMDPDEAPVLGLYAGPLVARALDGDARPLRHRPARHRSRSRSSRSTTTSPSARPACPGMVGALGASFGSVVTQDSPRARKPGEFNWQATMWHELAHVFTLQLSNQRVPRWVTEGISVYEEGLVDPSWPRDAELAFARAYGEGRVLKLADLNSGIARADTISLAYFESSLVVSLLVERHGQEALRVMLRAFADGADVESALRKATGSGLADLQTAFDARLEQRYGALGRALRSAGRRRDAGRRDRGRVAGARRAAPRQLPGADGGRRRAGRSRRPRAGDRRVRAGGGAGADRHRPEQPAREDRRAGRAGGRLRGAPCASCRHSSPPITRTSRPRASSRRSRSASATPRRRPSPSSASSSSTRSIPRRTTALGRIAIERRDARARDARVPRGAGGRAGRSRARALRSVRGAAAWRPEGRGQEGSAGRARDRAHLRRAQELLLKIVDGK